MNTRHLGEDGDSITTSTAIDRHTLGGRMLPFHDRTGRLMGARLNKASVELDGRTCDLTDLEEVTAGTFAARIGVPAIYGTLAEDGTLLQIGQSAHGLIRPLTMLTSLENCAGHVGLVNRSITIRMWSHSLLAVGHYRSVLEGLLIYFKGNRPQDFPAGGKSLDMVLNFLCQNREGPLRRKLEALAEIIDLELEMARRQLTAGGLPHLAALANRREPGLGTGLTR